MRELELRVDYSYTVLGDLIQIRGGSYGNTGKRAIHSVEGYAKLYLVGDHFLQASYTYLNAVDDRRRRPAQRCPTTGSSLGASFNLVKNLLDVNVNLTVFGAYEDPNRVPAPPGGAAPAPLHRHDAATPPTSRSIG